LTDKVLLIDADLFCYAESIAVEEVVQWPGNPDLHTLWSDLAPARAGMEDFIFTMKEKFETDDIVLAFTGEGSWRIDLWPDYKAHRRELGKRKPICYYPLIQYLKDTYPFIQFPRLEGDDVLGWLATNPDYTQDKEPIIISGDKDMLTIPAAYYNARKDEMRPKVDTSVGNYHHMIQTLVGDAADGYPGCPGIGKVRAPRLLEKTEDMWGAVVAAYRKAGLSEEDALLQARLAFILRYDNYNVKTGEVTLWTPDLLQ
jgi:DNA polymerase-1